jgi:hypothetical protein
MAETDDAKIQAFATLLPLAKTLQSRISRLKKEIKS